MVHRRLTVPALVAVLTLALVPMALADDEGDAPPDKGPKHVLAVALALDISEEAASDLLSTHPDINASQLIRLHSLAVVTGADLNDLIAEASASDVGYGDLKQQLTDEQLFELKLWKTSLGHYQRQVVGHGQALGHLDAQAKAEAKALRKSDRNQAKIDAKAARDDAKAERDRARADRKADHDASKWGPTEG